MATYRVYTIPAGGTRQPSKEVECSDHGAAVQFAFELSLRGEMVEVWSGSELVKVVRPGSYRVALQLFG